MGEHHPDGEYSTPGGTPLERIESEWRVRMFRSIDKLWGGLAEMQKDVTAIRLKMAQDDHSGQLADLKSTVKEQAAEIQSLKEFKIRAVTGFLLVQGLVGLALGVIAVLKH